jgi:hypothetical protein
MLRQKFHVGIMYEKLHACHYEKSGQRVLDLQSSWREESVRQAGGELHINGVLR